MKKIAIMVFCSLILSGMVACGSKDKTQNQSEPTATQSETQANDQTSTTTTSEVKGTENKESESGSGSGSGSESGAKEIYKSDFATISESNNQIIVTTEDSDVKEELYYNLENDELKSVHSKWEFIGDVPQSEIDELKKSLEENGYTNVQIDEKKVSAEQNNFDEKISKEQLINILKEKCEQDNDQSE